MLNLNIAMIKMEIQKLENKISSYKSILDLDKSL